MGYLDRLVHSERLESGRHKVYLEFRMLDGTTQEYAVAGTKGWRYVEAHSGFHPAVWIVHTHDEDNFHQRVEIVARCVTGVCVKIYNPPKKENKDA